MSEIVVSLNASSTTVNFQDDLVLNASNTYDPDLSDAN
jgi:hypothetical protein